MTRTWHHQDANPRLPDPESGPLHPARLLPHRHPRASSVNLRICKPVLAALVRQLLAQAAPRAGLCRRVPGAAAEAEGPRPGGAGAPGSSCLLRPGTRVQQPALLCAEWPRGRLSLQEMDERRGCWVSLRSEPCPRKACRPGCLNAVLLAKSHQAQLSPRDATVPQVPMTCSCEANTPWYRGERAEGDTSGRRPAGTPQRVRKQPLSSR